MAKVFVLVQLKVGVQSNTLISNNMIKETRNHFALSAIEKKMQMTKIKQMCIQLMALLLTRSTELSIAMVLTVFIPAGTKIQDQSIDLQTLFHFQLLLQIRMTMLACLHTRLDTTGHKELRVLNKSSMRTDYSLGAQSLARFGNPMTNNSTSASDTIK